METGKTDRRVQYTKRALTSALIDLMRENHISKISVKALCAAADVNRSTFYAHFRNQYDLLAYIEAEALEDLKARLLADGEPRTRNVEKILEYAKENADVFLMLLDESEGGFQRQIMELRIWWTCKCPTRMRRWTPTIWSTCTCSPYRARWACCRTGRRRARRNPPPRCPSC